MSLSDKIEELNGDFLAYGYKDYEKEGKEMSTMEICHRKESCNDFVIRKVKKKIQKDVKEFIRKDTELIMKHFPMNASMIALMSDRKEILGEDLI